MKPEELLELTTEELESASDEKLLEMLGPAVDNCRVLPGSEQEEKERKAAEKLKKEQEELELAAGNLPSGTDGTATSPNGTEIKLRKKRVAKPKAQKVAEQLADLLKCMTAQGITTTDFAKNLPTDLKQK